MNERAARTSKALSLVGSFLILLVALGVQAGPPVTTLPGRKPDSAEPWGAFLGRAAHEAIGRQYRVQHPFNTVFLDPVNLSTIVRDGKLGDPERLSKFVRLLRPDITDARALVLFEIKPDTEAGLEEGRDQSRRYLAALNEAAEPAKKLAGGTGFEGALFVEFERGRVLWQLSWRTPEPGVTLYRWSSRRAKSQALWKELVAQKEEELSREEAEQGGAAVEQAIRAAYDKGDWPDDFQGQVYLPVDCH